MRGFYSLFFLWFSLAPIACIATAQAPAFELRPLPGGPLQMAVICPRYTGLDAEALAARFDLNLQLIHTWDRHNLGYDPAAAPAGDDSYSRENLSNKMLSLFSKKPPLVLVLANLDLAALPEDFCHALRAYVEAGGGLALAYVQWPESGPWQELSAALQPLEESPNFSRGVPDAYTPDGTTLAEAANASTLGAGRVVTFNFSGDIPRHHALFPPATPGIDPDPHHLDHACLLWARVLPWLAQREETQRIISVENVSPDGPNDSETPPDLPKEFVESMRDTVVAQLMRPFAVTLDAPANTDYRLDVQLRPAIRPGPGYHTESKFPQGSTLIVPQLLCGSGAYYIDAAIYHKKELVDFFSVQATIENWPEFESLRADKTFLLANDTLTIEAQVRPVYSEHRSATVYAQALDSHGRLVAQAWQPITHSGGRVVLTLPFADLIAPLVEVRVMALEGPPRLVTPWDLYAAAIDILRFPVHLTGQDRNLHWAMVMPALAEENSARYLEGLAALGTTHVVAPGGRPAMVSAARVPSLLAPLVADYGADKAAPGLVRIPSFNDPAYAAREDERLREEVLDYYAGASGAYVLGNPARVVATEENASQDPHAIEAFRAWATRREIALPDSDEELRTSIAPAQDAAATNTDPYMNFRLFTEEAFASFLAARRDTLRKAHPDAIAGIIAASDDNPYHGYDWHGLAKNLDFAAPPWDLLTYFKLSSYGSRAALSGFQSDSTIHGIAPWLAAMGGFGALWTTEPLGTDTMLGETGDPTEASLALSQALAKCNATIGPLLHEARPAPATVAILDAPRSRHASGSAIAHYEQQQTQLIQMLYETGHWPTFMHASELATAYTDGIRALLWSGGTLLDVSELDALKAFVQQGGTLLSLSEDCEACKGLFASEGVVCLDSNTGSVLGAALEERDINLPLPIESKAWKRQAGTNLLARSFSYGQAQLLVSLPMPGIESKKMRALPLEFPKEGQLFHPLESERQSSANRRTALGTDGADAVAYLPYKVEDFELEAPETVPPGNRLEVLCTLKTDTLKPGRHLIHLTLSPPDGKPLPGGDRFVPCERGAARGYVSVPLNAIPGDYIVKARDLLTGLESQKMVEVLAISGPGFHALH